MTASPPGRGTARELSDPTIAHLRRVLDTPDFSATRYAVRSFIASGGMGEVYLAEDTELGRDVAIKVLGVTGDADAAHRMRREAEVIARLEHPAIVPVHDVGVLPDGRVFYVMKHVRGERLDRHLDLTKPLAERLEAFRRICEAVAFAHARGVVHRDLKPANIMLGAFGETLVMDWGLAKVVDAGEAPAEPPAGAADPAAETIARRPSRPSDGGEPTVHGTVLGTPGYMSPEQARGDVYAVGPRSDVYALGAILRLVAGGGAPGAERGPSRLPKRLAAIVARAMAVRPGERYESAAALAEDVRRFTAGEVVDAYPERPHERLARLAARYRVPILLVLAYVLARAAIILFRGRGAP